MDEEIVEKCRICTISSDCFSYFNIFEKIIFKNVLIYDALVLITSLQIHPDDDFPKTICCRCEQRLLDAYHFRRLAESSAKQFGILQQHISPVKVIETVQEVETKCQEISVCMDDGEHELQLDEHLLDADESGQELCEEDIKRIIYVSPPVEEEPPPTPPPAETPAKKRKSMVLQRLTTTILNMPEPTETPKRYKSTISSRKSTSPPTAATRQSPREKPAREPEDTVSFLINKLNSDQDVSRTVKTENVSPKINTDPEYAKRKHECQVCHKRFVGKSNLVDHLRYHANVKPFKCTECDKSFVQMGSLQCHMRTHTNEKPFACDVCEKAFSQSSSLKIHMRTHTLERKYACDICEKRFMSNSDMVKHRGIHDTVKRFKCDMCEDRFAQKVNLRKHIRRHHIPNGDEKKPTTRKRSAKVTA